MSFIAFDPDGRPDPRRSSSGYVAGVRSPRPISRISWTLPPRLSLLDRTLARSVLNTIRHLAAKFAAREMSEVLLEIESGDDPITAAMYTRLEQELARTVTENLLEEVLLQGVDHLDEIIRRYAFGDDIKGQIRSAALGHQARRELTGQRVTADDIGIGIPRLPPPRGWTFTDPNVVPSDAYFALRFDLVNPYAIDFASNAAYRLAGNVSRGIKDSIRQTITRGINDGWAIEDMRDQIHDVLGLHPRWARAVDNYHAGLLKRGGGLDWARKMTAKYAEGLRQKRAMMVARTEVMRAQNYGRLAAWGAAGGAGLIDVNASTKEWVTGPHVEQASKVDPRVSGPCNLCGPMDGKTVTGLDGLFVLPNSSTLLTPPAHPHCRCTIMFHPPEIPEWIDDEVVDTLVDWVREE